MKFYQYTIVSKSHETEGTYIMRLRPVANDSYSFQSGQYAYLKDPQFIDPEEVHPFSIASTPFESPTLEFCIKEYGDWTQEFLKRKVGDAISVSEAQGEFVWHKENTSAVFLLGGIGIAPVISMLRTFTYKNTTAELVVIYGNRRLDTIAYERDLQAIQAKLSNLKLILVFSDLKEEHAWDGYKGFITEEIIRKEVSLQNDSIFYFIGPDIFVQKMEQILKKLHVSQNKMLTESLS